MEQTVYLGSTTTDVVVYTQAIDSSGSHVALVVNTSTSKLVFADGTVSSATPTVASLGTGKAKVTFASISNSSLSAGDTVAVRINGTASGAAFSEYMIPVFIATASSGGGSSLTQADIRTAVGLASANLDTQLGDIPTVTEFNARTKPTADYFDSATDTVDIGKINGNATSASNLQKSTSQIIPGTISVSNVTPSVTTFAASNITESTTDHYKSRIIIFTSGNLSGQATDITGYSFSNSEGVFTVSEMTEAPSSSDTFVIV